MKILLALVLIVLSQNLFAWSIICNSPSGEVLSYQVSTGDITLSYASRGPEFTPLEDGPIRHISQAFYNMAFDDLKEILPQISIRWPLKTCKMNTDWWLSSCGNGGALISNKEKIAKIQVNGISLSKLTESGASGDQVNFRFRIIFEKDGNTYFVPLIFSQQFCKVTEV